MPKLKALVGRVQASVRRFWVQDIIAVASVATIIYLGVRGLPIPDILAGIAWAVIGYHFGSAKQEPVTPERAAPLGVPSSGDDSKLQRTQHGGGSTRLVHFQGVHPPPRPDLR